MSLNSAVPTKPLTEDTILNLTSTRSPWTIEFANFQLYFIIFYFFSPNRSFLSHSHLAGLLLDSLIDNVHVIPDQFRVVLNSLREDAKRCGLGNGRAAVGGVLFLRVIVPTIIKPNVYDPEAPFQKEILKGRNNRKLTLWELKVFSPPPSGLLVVSKLVQCLSNGTLPR